MAARCETAAPSRMTGSKRQRFTASTAAWSNVRCGCELRTDDVLRRAVRRDRELDVDPTADALPFRFARIAGRHFAHALQRFRLDDVGRERTLLLRCGQLRLQRLGRRHVRHERVDAAQEASAPCRRRPRRARCACVRGTRTRAAAAPCGPRSNPDISRAAPAVARTHCCRAARAECRDRAAVHTASSSAAVGPDAAGDVALRCSRLCFGLEPALFRQQAPARVRLPAHRRAASAPAAGATLIGVRVLRDSVSSSARNASSRG